MTDRLAAEAVILARRARRGFLPTPVSRADAAHLPDVTAREGDFRRQGDRHAASWQGHE